MMNNVFSFSHDLLNSTLKAYFIGSWVYFVEIMKECEFLLRLDVVQRRHLSKFQIKSTDYFHLCLEENKYKINTNK